VNVKVETTTETGTRDNNPAIRLPQPSRRRWQHLLQLLGLQTLMPPMVAIRITSKCGMQPWRNNKVARVKVSNDEGALS
jgi:hypothetical protein